MKTIRLGCTLIVFLFLFSPSDTNGQTADPAESYSSRDSQAFWRGTVEKFRDEYMRPVYQEWQLAKSRNKGKIVPQTDPSGPLFGDQEVEKRIWRKFSEDVIAIRGLRAATITVMRNEQRRIEFARITDNEVRLAGFVECDTLRSIIEPKMFELEAARARAGMIVLHLSNLDDARTIRILAPILMEEDLMQKISIDDPLPEGFALVVASKLEGLLRRGVFSANIPENVALLPAAQRAEIWRKWWIENRVKFGPVYEIPQPTPPEEPPDQRRIVVVPESGQNSDTPIKSSEPVTPPDGNTVKPLESGGEVPFWMVIAAVVAAMAGVLWAVFRKTRKLRVP